MTKQEAFDKMVAHLAHQKHRCVIDSVCAYRGPDGTKCIVGAMISDETAALIDGIRATESTSISNDPVWEMAKAELALEDLREPRDKIFYIEMQEVHDLSYTLEDIQARLRRIAVHYELDPAIVGSITAWSR